MIFIVKVGRVILDLQGSEVKVSFVYCIDNVGALLRVGWPDESSLQNTCVRTYRWVTNAKEKPV